MIKEKHCLHECPVCGSEDLQYDGGAFFELGPDKDTMECAAECFDCGTDVVVIYKYHTTHYRSQVRNTHGTY